MAATKIVVCCNCRKNTIFKEATLFSKRPPVFICPPCKEAHDERIEMGRRMMQEQVDNMSLEDFEMFRKLID
jgi:hypothetical protein